jgi:hypothetical protein
LLRVIYRREFHILLDRALRPETRQAYFDAFGFDDDVNTAHPLLASSAELSPWLNHITFLRCAAPLSVTPAEAKFSQFQSKDTWSY